MGRPAILRGWPLQTAATDWHTPIGCESGVYVQGNPCSGASSVHFGVQRNRRSDRVSPLECVAVRIHHIAAGQLRPHQLQRTHQEYAVILAKRNVPGRYLAWH